MIKKALLLFVLLMFSFSVFASSSSFDEQKSSPQYYQQAEEPIQPLHAKKKSADASVSQADDDSSALQGDQISASGASAMPQESLAVLQAELSQINQNYVMFQQKTDDRFLDLSNQYQALKHQVNQLNQAMTLLNQEIASLNTVSQAVPARAAEPSKPNSSAKRGEAAALAMASEIFDSPLFKWLLAGGFLVVLLLGWAFWPKRETPQRPQYASSSSKGDASFEASPEDDTKDEYDYMGSVESVPAKLDLARTYIAMEDYRAARVVLQEVMKQGDDKQQAQAKKLLDKMPITE